MYFKNFPLMNYSLDGGTTTFLATDFFRRIVARTNNILGATAYTKYVILEGETPDILADKLYNDTNLYWVILVANNIMDPRWEWPLSTLALNAYITDKYGAGNEYAIHHYENILGDVVHSSYAGVKTAINNSYYENQLNEDKRSISVLKAQFVPTFLDSFNGLLNG
jgi:hypothetical protein